MSANTLDPSDPTFKDVWDVLSAIDCNEHTDKKNGLTYLSWAWAWGIVMDKYPYAQYEMLDNEVLSDDSVIVWCEVTIGHLKRKMWLAVMDYKNQPVKNPSSTQVSNSRMRCLTKCLSMYGLGHYIYAGEDIPQETSKTPAPAVNEPAVQEPVVEKKSEAATDGENTFGSAQEAENAATFFIETVQSMNSDSLESLADAWRQNKRLIDTFDQHFPEQYQRVKAFFTETKLKLKES